MTRLRLRLDFDSGAQLGPGKVQLLEAIEAQGSISAAGRRLGMSYRRAWQLVEALNAAFREPLVTAQQGGSGGGGAALTPAGREVALRYRRLEAITREAAGHELDALEAILAPVARP